MKRRFPERALLQLSRLWAIWGVIWKICSMVRQITRSKLYPAYERLKVARGTKFSPSELFSRVWTYSACRPTPPLPFRIQVTCFCQSAAFPLRTGIVEVATRCDA